MAAGPDRVFGVQRHDADRAGLHYDLRLERDGMLKSWSMPKGMPTNKRHLAIATPDHKMSWLKFEGDIPEGDYGAGNVKLDSKSTYKTVSYKPKKWVFYVNSGKYQGKYTLVHWKDNKWLISRNKDQSMAAESEDERICFTCGEVTEDWELINEGYECLECSAMNRTDYEKKKWGPDEKCGNCGMADPIALTYFCDMCHGCEGCCECKEAENTEVLNAEWFTWYSGQYVLVRNVYRIYNRSVSGEEIVLPEEYSLLDDAVEELVNLIEYDTSIFEMGVYQIQTGMAPKVSLEVKWKHQEFSGDNPEAVKLADEKSYDRWNRDHLIDEPDDFLIGATDLGDIVTGVFTEAAEDEYDSERSYISIDPLRDRSGDDELYADSPCPLCGFNSMAEHACGTPGNSYCNDCCAKMGGCGVCDLDWEDSENDSGLLPEEVKMRYSKMEDYQAEDDWIVCQNCNEKYDVFCPQCGQPTCKNHFNTEFRSCTACFKYLSQFMSETNKKLHFMDPKRRLRKLVKDIDIDPETASKRISFNAGD